MPQPRPGHHHPSRIDPRPWSVSISWTLCPFRINREIHTNGYITVYRYSPGTADNGYGYSAATSLTSAKAVLNADSYALYANGKCQVRFSTGDSQLTKDSNLPWLLNDQFPCNRSE